MIYYDADDTYDGRYHGEGTGDVHKRHGHYGNSLDIDDVDRAYNSDNGG
jgi:hypothetical protein